MPEAHRRCENSTPAQRERHEKLQEGTTLARRRAREFLFRIRQLRHALGRLPLPLVQPCAAPAALNTCWCVYR